MADMLRAQDSRLQAFFVATAYILQSANFAINYISFGKPFLDWDKYIGFEERLPYQARCLMALVYRQSESIISHVPFLLKLGGLLPGQISNPIHAITAYVITLLSFLISALLAQVIRIHLFPLKFPTAPRSLRNLIILLPWIYIMFGLYVLNPNLNFILPYDLPSVAFQFILLAMILKRFHILMLLPMFIVATLNRESTMLILIFTVILSFTSRKTDSYYYPRVASSFLLAWIGIKIILRQVFSNSGSDQSFSLIRNFGYLLEGIQIPSIFPLIVMLSVFVIALLTCLRQEQQSPEVFAIVLTGLFGFVLLFYHTWIVEMRAYGDLAPYFFVAYCLIPIDSKGDRIDS